MTIIIKIPFHLEINRRVHKDEKLHHESRAQWKDINFTKDDWRYHKELMIEITVMAKCKHGLNVHDFVWGEERGNCRKKKHCMQ